MDTEQNRTDGHVGEALSGYIDGELTQQQRQQVELHCQDCSECQRELEALKALRERVGQSGLSLTGADHWRENMNDPGVRSSRNLGWMLFIGGLVAAVGAVLVVFFLGTDVPLLAKLIVGGTYGGLALLLYSVLRQRIIESRTDKYKDVEI